MEPSLADEEVSMPVLVAKLSTMLTAATPAIYQDAAKNSSEFSLSRSRESRGRLITFWKTNFMSNYSRNSPDELSENIVKPVTLMLNSVSGGVTALAKDNSRRFFVPSFVRLNFRAETLVELDRIRRTERFWNETEAYVNHVCGRLRVRSNIERL